MKIWYQREIRSRKSKKDRQYNGQKKKYKDKQRSTIHFGIKSSFIVYHRVYNKRTTYVTSGAGTASPSGSPLVFSEVRVARSFSVWCFVDHCLFFCPFSFGHRSISPSYIYVFCLLLWYLQTFLKKLLFNDFSWSYVIYLHCDYK
jgi:hypothetical protein